MPTPDDAPAAPTTLTDVAVHVRTREALVDRMFAAAPERIRALAAAIASEMATQVDRAADRVMPIVAIPILCPAEDAPAYPLACAIWSVRGGAEAICQMTPAPAAVDTSRLPEEAQGAASVLNKLLATSDGPKFAGRIVITWGG